MYTTGHEKGYCIYGYRTCGRSDNHYDVSKVVMVLDQESTEAVVTEKDTLRINWFRQKTSIDFDAVEIINATDEMVERFVIQMRNTTEGAKQAEYKNSVCSISSTCRLSQNTMRILKHYFIQVKEIETI